MGAADTLLSDLNDRQREAVTTLASPLAILAGAGSGKTRVLTRRIAWLAAEGVLDPRHALAVTFTRKAAGELADRLERLGVRRAVTSGTFHGLALAQLRRRWRDRGEAVPALLERKSRILVPLLGGGPSVGAEAADVAGEIEWAKARLVRVDDYEAALAAAGRVTPRPAGEIASLYGRYETEKARRGLVDFDDLLWRLGDVLESDAEFAAVVRWRHRHLFVDEFQDVNPAQFRLLRLWLGERPDLCVVGDDDQAVYGFTGADAGYLVHFTRFFPGAAVVRLEENYRSTPQILAAAHAVLPGGTRRKKPLRPTLPDGALPSVTVHESDREEAAAVARAIQAAHQPGTPWSGTAVLYRTNAQSAPLEAALRAAGVPYRVRGAARFLDRPAVVGALDELRRAAAAAPGLPLVAHLAGLLEWAEEGGGGAGPAGPGPGGGRTRPGHGGGGGRPRGAGGARRLAQGAGPGVRRAGAGDLPRRHAGRGGRGPARQPRRPAGAARPRAAQGRALRRRTPDDRGPGVRSGPVRSAGPFLGVALEVLDVVRTPLGDELLGQPADVVVVHRQLRFEVLARLVGQDARPLHVDRRGFDFTGVRVDPHLLLVRNRSLHA
jgi:DNA helicase-2/ATP-dependent DNA helicase PcrA